MTVNCPTIILDYIIYAYFSGNLLPIDLRVFFSILMILTCSLQTVDGCKKENCPIAKCKCTTCVDHNNITHVIGSEFSGADVCDTFICSEGNKI